VVRIEAVETGQQLKPSVYSKGYVAV